jgi:hypothetical protein
MLLAYNVEDTPVQCKNIGAYTASKDVPSDLYVMVSTAINKINKPLIFIPFDVQYIVSESTTGGTINRILPKMVITGGITGFDKDMIEKSREGDASGGWAGAQGGARYSADGKVSRVSLDLSMMDYKTQAYFPGVNTSNSILLRSDGLTWGIYGYYMGNGASFDYELRKKQGVHAALRNLVEFSVIELIGKTFSVPYWRVVPGAKPDSAFSNQVYDNFKNLSENGKIAKLKNLLFVHGYSGVDLDSETLSRGEQEIIARAMEKTRSKNIARLYIALWQSVPIETGKTRVVVRRRMQRRANRRQQAQVQRQEQENAKRLAAIKEKELMAHKKKVSDFRAYVADGDKFFNKKDYTAALEQYMAAHQLFGGEKYPVQRINQINGYFARKKQVADSFKQRLTATDKLFAEIEAASFNFAAYGKVKAVYQALLKESPGNSHIKEQLQRIDSKMNKYKVNFDLNGGW